jgi:hypothetical protein
MNMNDVTYRKEVIHSPSPPRRTTSGNGRTYSLGLVSALCAVMGFATVSTGAFADRGGLGIERDYQRRQIECARRWRDHFHDANIFTMGCIGFEGSTPTIAKEALVADARGETYIGPERMDWTP